MKNINQIEWKALLEKEKEAVIIDCRGPFEWEEGVLEGAKLIDLMSPQGFMHTAEKLNKEKSYYVYCRSGIRSITACQILESMGIEKTYNLLGGILSWDGKVVMP